MAKVYSLPEELEKELPVVDFSNYDREVEQAKEKAFLEKAKTWAKEYAPKDALAGEEYRISHADGYARYLVASSSPVVLLHLPLGDAWDSPWADRVKKSDILAHIKREAFWKDATKTQ